MSYEMIKVETETIAAGGIGIITLNRPDALNALNSTLIGELACALEGFEANDDVGAIIITGSQKAFAAGADIKEMADLTYPGTFTSDFAAKWDAAARCRKPTIAAVSGFALGGGCELAMQCDIILAADTAKFGQPEITLGIMPGIGGTQRLVRAIGKSKAMELCLTGRMMDAAEAEASGLVARIVPADDLMTEAKTTAAKIASHATPAVMMTKETINRAFETSLSEGILFERRLFQSMFATADQKEGMQAFIEKRKPDFKKS